MGCFSVTGRWRQTFRFPSRPLLTRLYCWAQGAQGFNFPRGLQSHDGGGGQLPPSGNDIWCPTRPALMTLAGSGEVDGLLTACIGGRPGVLWAFMGVGGASPCGVWREWSCIVYSVLGRAVLGLPGASPGCGCSWVTSWFSFESETRAPSTCASSGPRSLLVWDRLLPPAWPSQLYLVGGIGKSMSSPNFQKQSQSSQGFISPICLGEKRMEGANTQDLCISCFYSQGPSFCLLPGKHRNQG